MQDCIRVDSKDASEVEDFHSMYPGLSQKAIKAAIKCAGPMRSEMKINLGKRLKK